MFINKLKNSKFLSQSKNYLIAELFNKGVAFLTIPIYTRLLLPNEYGILSVYNAIVSIFIVLLGLNFNGAITRYYYEKDRIFDDFLKTNILFLFIYNLISIFVCYSIRNSIAVFLHISGRLFFFAVIVSVFSVYYNIYLSKLQASQQSKKYARISIIVNFILVILSLIFTFLLSKNRYYGKVYASFLVMFIFFSYFFLKVKDVLFFANFNKKHLKYALSFGLPLIPHILSALILIQFDRIMINKMVGSTAAGIYSFAYNIGMIMNIIVLAMNKAWVPIFYENLKNKNYLKIQSLAENYAKLIFIFALLLIFFNKELVVILSTKAYYEALNIVPIIVISYIFIFMYTLFGNYSFYNKKTILISMGTVTAAIINIILNYLFIPEYGYIAAAWTTLISYIFLFFFHFIIAKYVIKEKTLRLNKILLYMTLFLFAVFCYYLINYLFSFSFFFSLFIKFLLIVVIFIIYFKKNIIEIKKNE